MKAVTEVLKYRKIIYSTTLSDIKAKYAGSVLGYIWLFLYPFIFLGVYAVVYIAIFKIRLQVLSPYAYVLLIFAGLIPFLSFSEAFARGVTAVSSNSNLIKNTLFPIELIPVNITLSSQIVQVVGFSLMSIFLLASGKLGACLPLLLPLWILQIMFTVGVVWTVSAINVFFRDMATIVSIAIMMLMMISPIAYTEEMIPEGLRPFLYINPLYYMIMLYQKILVFNSFDLRLFSIFAAISLAQYFFGYFFFVRLKGVFSDYV